MKFNKTIVVTMIALAMSGQANSQLSGLIGKAKAAKAAKNYVPIFEIEGTKPSTPSKLSMQDKYAGKIVFSDQRLTLESTSEDLFKSSFSLGDPIYARVFTSNSVENYMLYNSKYGQTLDGETANMRDSYTIYYYIDDVEIMAWQRNNRFENGLSGVNTWQRTVLLPNSQEQYDLDSERQRNALNNLSVGTHKVKVVIWAGERKALASIKPIAEGEFDLIVKEGAVVKIGKNWNDIKNGDLAKDPKVKNKLTELYTEQLKKEYPEYTLKEIKIPGDGYSIYKDNYGLPKHRTATTSAYMIDKKT